MYHGPSRSMIAVNSLRILYSTAAGNTLIRASRDTWHWPSVATLSCGVDLGRAISLGVSATTLPTGSPDPGAFMGSNQQPVRSKRGGKAACVNMEGFFDGIQGAIVEGYAIRVADVS